MVIARLLSLLAAVCLAAATAAAQDNIKIGANLPMSGPNAEYGELFGGAANLAAEHANAIRRKDLSITTHPAYTTAAGPMWPVSGAAARGPIALRLLAYKQV